MKKFLTIFTPTYNRAYILPKLYKSLVAQTNKNFVWLIVDDGSSDGTEALIQSFKSENLIEIEYLYQENKGKHFAINNGIKNTDTDFFIVIDSDDFITENAVAEMEILAAKIQDDQQIAGFTILYFPTKTPYDKEKYGKKEWISNGKVVYDWEFQGEMIFGFKTAIHKQFLFPEFEGEKFCAESLVLRRIERQYKILCTDKVLAFGDYLEDGLSSKFYQLILKNPKGSLLNIKERFKDPLSKQEKHELAKTYWDVASKTNQDFSVKFFGISPFLILNVLVNKFKKKIIS